MSHVPCRSALRWLADVTDIVFFFCNAPIADEINNLEKIVAQGPLDDQECVLSTPIGYPVFLKANIRVVS